jgi:phage I-like protein
MKSKIDEMIEKEPLALQGNPTLIRNAYKVVLADHFEQIQKGEIRSRLASAAGSGTQSGKPSGSSNTDELPSLSADQKKAALMFGISEKDYATEMKNMELGVL